MDSDCGSVSVPPQILHFASGEHRCLCLFLHPIPQYCFRRVSPAPPLKLAAGLGAVENQDNSFNILNQVSSLPLCFVSSF